MTAIADYMDTSHSNTGLRGTLLENEPMARHTSWRIGGSADQFYQPVDLEDLKIFLQQLSPDMPITWIGLGSNVLVRDGGLRGVVIYPHKGLVELVLVDKKTIYAQVGLPGAKIARFSVNKELQGAEFMAGIPGTLGGALAMNAGAFGSETWDIVLAVETIDAKGEIRKRPAADYEPGYRSLQQPAPEWFVGAFLGLQSGSFAEGRERIRSLLAKRASTQPTNLANAGSVFRNPPGDYAARLIEAAGLKGYCIGKAMVSEQHSNFIINVGSATAVDVELLIKKIQTEVKRKFDVLLQPEVRIIGEQA
ncbi:UDP-N-acetylmuramate dehydrogenase [Pseudomonadota bacterium]